MANETEAMGVRLLQGFNEEAKGNTESAVLAAGARGSASRARAWKG